MTAYGYGSLQHIFVKPLPENPTLIESLFSWQPPLNPPSEEQSPFTEIFGELHFKESTQFRSTNFSRTRNESLQLCTEGLGSESSDDHIEDLKNKYELDDEVKNHEEEEEEEEEEEQEREQEEKASYSSEESYRNWRRHNRTSSGGSSGSFPPPISCIGKSGKPWVCFKAYRGNGRFVLKVVRIPRQEFLRACREDGRLRLQIVQPEDDTIYEEEEMEEEEFELNGEEEGAEEKEGTAGQSSDVVER